ncbi:MAG: hypothetical protein ACE5FU_00600 [Nitrospinota bacterium]
MTTLFALAGHILLNFLQGWAVLRHVTGENRRIETLCASVLVGIYLETLLLGVFLFFGFSFSGAPVFILLLTLFFVVLSVTKKKIMFSFNGRRFSGTYPRWFEVVVLLLVFEKIGFSLWALNSTPVYFDDALTHWAARGKALFGGVNWSFEPGSDVFMGFTGHKHYPLMTPLWRAATATFVGQWNDTFARADGLIFFVVTLLTVWSSVFRFSESRFLAAVSVFLLSSLPFHIWHSFSGFSDIAVEVFCVASLAALLRKEWFLAGVFAAGTAWAKNDGVVLCIPPLFLAGVVVQPTIRGALRAGGKFILGVGTLVPWFGFKIFLLPGISPGGEGFSLHTDVFRQFARIVVNGPTHSIFWIFVALLFCTTFHLLVQDYFGRGLLVFLITSLLTILLVFGMTDAYRFLVNEMTVHRTMLQFYGVSVVFCMYAVSLCDQRKKAHSAFKIENTQKGQSVFPSVRECEG